ncbi:MAG: hypothetical protein DRI57_23655 [Deltaproteobacteria bacterium]|nr:MAG: hypothetical protein DRI57_23655 [Deltaproteobacteria bacterium]
MVVRYFKKDTKFLIITLLGNLNVPMTPHMHQIEIVGRGCKPRPAREALPSSFSIQIYMTANDDCLASPRRATLTFLFLSAFPVVVVRGQALLTTTT